ncbi:hypothetical protein DF011_25585 [Burkholderia ubonensis]|nr:hypothetical protein CJO70_16610 [Burkholderia ubonensis]PAJ93606.1 hypothetical protein CJO69_14990 [Burkholderia ubonensis]PAK06887.1 hypothetical protein CJO67_16995 [Burkholderia ubonensis]RQP68868.1 hypothetical protein DF013_27060 [Burkholderia ubonensis]RQP75813.1 hypothetical protein DF014_25865 [Burkholderia ubonensis]
MSKGRRHVEKPDSALGSYRSQLHEEDAYACAEVVRGYWNRPDRPLVRNPGTCTADYTAALEAVRAGS